MSGIPISDGSISTGSSKSGTASSTPTSTSSKVTSNTPSGNEGSAEVRGLTVLECRDALWEHLSMSTLGLEAMRLADLMAEAVQRETLEAVESIDE